VVSPDGVATSQMVGVSVFLNLPLHRKVQKFSSGTGGSGKRAVKRLWCGCAVSKEETTEDVGMISVSFGGFIKFCQNMKLW